MEDIRKIGKDLTRKDFEEYAKLSPIEKVERKKLLTTDEDLRDAYEKQIKAIKAEQADRESALESAAEQEALARERALEKGPNTWKKIWWTTQNFSKNGIEFLKCVGAFLTVLVMGISLVALIAFIAFAVVGAPIGIFIQSICYGLGNNFAVYFFAWVILLFFSFAFIDDAKVITFICGALLAVLGYSNLFWTNIAPNKGYVGIVTNKEKVVTQTVSANQFWMKAPNWWRNEKVTWYSVVDPTKDYARSNSMIERLLTSKISKEIEIGTEKLKADLEVSILIEPKLDGFAKLAGDQPEAGTEGREKILAEARNILERVGSTNPEQLKNLANEISALSNDLFKVSKVTVNFSSNSSVEAEAKGGGK